MTPPKGQDFSAGKQKGCSAPAPLENLSWGVVAVLGLGSQRGEQSRVPPVGRCKVGMGGKRREMGNGEQTGRLGVRPCPAPGQGFFGGGRATPVPAAFQRAGMKAVEQPGDGETLQSCCCGEGKRNREEVLKSLRGRGVCKRPGAGIAGRASLSRRGTRFASFLFCWSCRRKVCAGFSPAEIRV